MTGPSNPPAPLWERVLAILLLLLALPCLLLGWLDLTLHRARPVITTLRPSDSTQSRRHLFNTAALPNSPTGNFLRQLHGLPALYSVTTGSLRLKSALVMINSTPPQWR